MPPILATPETIHTKATMRHSGEHDGKTDSPPQPQQCCQDGIELSSFSLVKTDIDDIRGSLLGVFYAANATITPARCTFSRAPLPPVAFSGFAPPYMADGTRDDMFSSSSDFESEVDLDDVPTSFLGFCAAPTGRPMQEADSDDADNEQAGDEDGQEEDSAMSNALVPTGDVNGGADENAAGDGSREGQGEGEGDDDEPSDHNDYDADESTYDDNEDFDSKGNDLPNRSGRGENRGGRPRKSRATGTSGKKASGNNGPKKRGRDPMSSPSRGSPSKRGRK